jgi:putative transposase
VLDILVQDWRNATAAKCFFKRLLAGLKYKPKRIITDGLRSYGAAKREVLPNVRHRTSRYLNNRAENSHESTQPCGVWSGSGRIPAHGGGGGRCRSWCGG